jgi:hypothetical protein
MYIWAMYEREIFFYKYTLKGVKGEMELNNTNGVEIIKYTVLGALSYFIAGLVEGIVLLRYEAMLSFPAEGIIGGLIFGFFLVKHFNVVRTVLASLAAIVIGLFVGAFIGLLIFDGYFVSSLVSGFLVGGIFGLVMGARSKSIQFAIIAAVVFSLGDLITSYVFTWEGGFHGFITEVTGDVGYIVTVVALTALYHGVAIGLGTGLYLKRLKGKGEE